MGYKLVIDGVPVSEYNIFGEACAGMLLEMEKSVREYGKNIDIVDVKIYFMPE